MRVLVKTTRLLALAMLVPSLGGHLAGQAHRPELMWEVGSVLGDEASTWQGLHDAVVLDSGVFALDRKIPVIRLYGLDGSFALTVAGQGGGPGEVAIPFWLRPVPGDRIVAYDWGQQRVAEYDATTGRPVATRRIETHLMPSGDPQVMRGGAEVRVTGSRSLADGRQLAVALMAHDGMVDTIASVSGMRVSFRVGPNPHWTSAAETGTGPSGGVAVGGDSLVVILDGMVPELRILRFTDEATPSVRTIPLPGDPVPLSAEHEQVLIEREDRLWTDFGLSIDDFRVPESWSAWTGVELEPAGAGVWIRAGGPHLGENEEEWRRFDLSSGSLGGGIVLPPGVRAIAFTPTYLAAVREDQLEVQYLQFYRIR